MMEVRRGSQSETEGRLGGKEVPVFLGARSVQKQGRAVYQVPFNFEHQVCYRVDAQCQGCILLVIGIAVVAVVVIKLPAALPGEGVVRDLAIYANLLPGNKSDPRLLSLL